MRKPRTGAAVLSPSRRVQIAALALLGALLLSSPASAQSPAAQSPAALPKPAAARTAATQPALDVMHAGQKLVAPNSALAEPGQPVLANAGPGSPSLPVAKPAATNAEPVQPGRALQSKPARPFFENIPELAFSQPKGNEIVFDRFSLSGISIQLVKARNPLQLINPAAPPQYGSGVDNVEWFPAGPSGPMLKLFSINF